MKRLCLVGFALLLIGCRGGIVLPPCLTDGSLCQPTPTASPTPTPTSIPTLPPPPTVTPTVTVTPTPGPDCKYPSYPVCVDGVCVCSQPTATSTPAPTPTGGPTKPPTASPTPAAGLPRALGFGSGLLGGQYNFVNGGPTGKLVKLDSTARACSNIPCTTSTACPDDHPQWLNGPWCLGHTLDTQCGPAKWRVVAWDPNTKGWVRIPLYVFDPKTRNYQPVSVAKADGGSDCDYWRFIPFVSGQQVQSKVCGPTPWVTVKGETLPVFGNGCIIKTWTMD